MTNIHNFEVTIKLHDDKQTITITGEEIKLTGTIRPRHLRLAREILEFVRGHRQSGEENIGAERQ
jgi:hypothetical protein